MGMVGISLWETGLPLRDGPTPWAACQPMVVGLSEAADSTMDSASWGFSKLDLTQNLEKAMHAIALARCRLGLALEGFSLSATALDIRELPAALRHPLANAAGNAYRPAKLRPRT